MYDQDHVFSGDATLPGLLESVRAAGVHTDNRGGQVYVSDPIAAAAIAAAFDPLAYARSEKCAEAGERWWAVRNGGHTTGAGIALKTDDGSMTLISGAYACAVSGAQSEFSFRDATGTWLSLSAAQIMTLFADVSAWMQAVFSVWHAYDIQIAAAATWQDVNALDVTQNWPG